MSFRRVVNYYKFRSVRIQASEHSIAAGIAFGCLVSWTPTFGTHLLQCALFCWLTRTSFIASVIGSAFGNFLTTPALMLIAYHAGKVILTVLGYDHLLVSHTIDAVTEETLESDKIFMPTLIGGYAVGIITFPIYYYASFYTVKAARAARRQRIERNIHAKAVGMTGQAK